MCMYMVRVGVSIRVRVSVMEKGDKGSTMIWMGVNG